MHFSINSTVAESSAILYLYANELPAAQNTHIVQLLQQQLNDKTAFAHARVPQENAFAEYAIVRLPEDKRSMWEKNSKEAAIWAAKQTRLTVVADGLNANQATHILPILVLALGEATYRFDDYKTEKKPAQLQEVVLNFGEHNAALQTVLLQAQALLHGVRLCKDLANTPPNVCTPTYLAQVAEQEAQNAGASVKILGADYIRQNMGAFWSVAKGSVQEPRLIELSYFGAADKTTAPTILVGKGITFDTGGISLKPGEGMDEMKYDMCGAASVIGTFIAAARAKLPINLMAIVPTCENMPDGAASKPGDIVTTMNGTTVEILNTDAEGRLILCDALTYAEQFKPAAVIDVATLTGACIIALGHAASGLAANDQDLADAILAASRASGDKAWQLPLFDEYREQLQSNFADLQNIGGRPAGTLTAATFLAHFMQQQKWAHLDIAGTAWKSGKDKGATGRPVPLLWAYLQQLV